MLVTDAEKHCQALLDSSDEIGPAASLLAQAIYACNFRKIPVPASASQTLEVALAKVSESSGSLIYVTSVVAPTAAEVLALTARIETARYSKDYGFRSVRPVIIAARRLLDSDEAGNDAKAAAFAIELLADHAIGTWAAEDPWEPPIRSVPASIEEPGVFAQEISKTGIAVSLLGMGESGRLARVTARNGYLAGVVYEAEDVFSRTRLSAWSKEFHYRYGIDGDVPNLFYTSMSSLGLTTTLTERTAPGYGYRSSAAPAEFVSCFQTISSGAEYGSCSSSVAFMA